MSLIQILSPGSRVAACSDLARAKGFVLTEDVPVSCAEIHARILGLPLVQAMSVFRLSPQSLRYKPTVNAVAQVGQAIFYPLGEKWTRSACSPVMRGTDPVLLTAYVLARAYGVGQIEYRRSTIRSHVLSVSETFLARLDEHKIRIDCVY